MYKIEKIILDGLELLPDITHTHIWNDYDFTDGSKCSKRVRLAAILYDAISKRENYYQINSPTMFGNPEYRYLCGLVNGILQAEELEEKEGDDLIIIKKENKTILIIDKINRPESYRVEMREISRTMKEFGL